MVPAALFTNREIVFWQLLVCGLQEVYSFFPAQKQRPPLFISALSLRQWAGRGSLWENPPLHCHPRWGTRKEGLEGGYQPKALIKPLCFEAPEDSSVPRQGRDLKDGSSWMDVRLGHKAKRNRWPLPDCQTWGGPWSALQAPKKHLYSVLCLLSVLGPLVSSICSIFAIDFF